MKPQQLSQVKDWPGIWRWASENNIPVEEGRKHRTLIVNGKKIFASRTPSSGRRSALNCRADIRKALGQ